MESSMGPFILFVALNTFAATVSADDSSCVLGDRDKLVPVQQTAVVDVCHTQYCQTHWQGMASRETFFDARTFGSQLLLDPCQNMTKQAFRTLINRLIACSGTLCVGNRFACAAVDQTSCYHVEHIVDRIGPEFMGFNKDIVGNYVMAWGAWNMALGRIKMTRIGYAAMMSEKELIYGAKWVHNARQLIQQCHRQQSLHI